MSARLPAHMQRLATNMLAYTVFEPGPDGRVWTVQWAHVRRVLDSIPGAQAKIAKHEQVHADHRLVTWLGHDAEVEVYVRRLDERAPGWRERVREAASLGEF